MLQENLVPKPFFGRRWAINKLSRYVNSDADSAFHSDSSPRTVLIVGGAGCGKTSLISHIFHNRNDPLIYPQIGCAVYSEQFISPLELLLSINTQLQAFFRTRGLHFNADRDNFRSLPLNDNNFSTLSQQFNSLVVHPLKAIHWRSGSKVVVFIDDIDKSFVSSQSSNQLNTSLADLNDSVVSSSSLSDMTSSSKDNLSSAGPVLTNYPLVDLLLQNQNALPQWLLIVASCNRRSKTVIRSLSAHSACRKFILDGSKRHEVADDLRGYCQMRLSADGNVFLGDNKVLANIIEKLLLKSNGCTLYLEKAFDLLVSRCLLPAEVQQLPATLNGFYLWLCERTFAGVDFQRDVKPFFAALVRDKSLPFDDSLYDSFPTLSRLLDTLPLLEHILTLSSVAQSLSPHSTSGASHSPVSRATTSSLVVSFFHQSFAVWLTDLKLCTRRFQVAESVLPPSESGRAQRSYKSPRKVQQQTAKAISKMHPSSSSGGGGAIHSISFGPRQTLSLNTALDDYRKQLFSAIENNDFDTCQDLLRSPPVVDSDLSIFEITDEFGQTPLILASKCGFEKAVQFLVESGAKVGACDYDGWTPLRSAAWSGHMGVIELLISSGAEVNTQLDVLPDGDPRTNGSTALDAAILNGQVEAVRRLLQSDALVNLPDCDGSNRTPLMTACLACKPEIARVLLDSGADMAAKDSMGRTCLHMALLNCPQSASEEDCLVQVLSALLDAGCQAEVSDNEGSSPLHFAASRGLVHACELLLENDCDVDCADNLGRTALFLAASQGHEEALRMLLYWNASVDAIDAQGWSALSVASRFGDVGCVEMLLDRGLDENHCDNDGSSPLHLAAANNHIRICELLIERGARLDALGALSQSPLMVASSAGHVPVITCLLRAGANPHLFDINGNDALRLAVAAEQWPVVRVLSRYVDVNSPDAAGHPPLFTAAFSSSLSLATVLLQCGAHPNLCDSNGRSPLHVAAWQGHCDVMKILIQFNANVNSVDNEGRSPLHSAAWQGNTGACRILLEAGASVDHVCAQGATALCIAAQEGHAALVQLLLDFGANPSHVDQFGRTALRMALKNSHMEVVSVLERISEVAAGTGNSQTSTDSALTRNTYTSGSGSEQAGAIITNLSGGGIIVSPAGTGLRASTSTQGSQLLMQTSQIDSSTGDSQSGGGSLSFGVAAADFLGVPANERIGGTRSFERGMRQRRSIANSNLVQSSNRGGPDGVTTTPSMVMVEEVQQQFLRGVNVRRSLQPQPVSQPPSYNDHHHHRFNNNNRYIASGIDFSEEPEMNSNYAALASAFDGVNISSLDEQAERMAEAYSRAINGGSASGNMQHPVFARSNEQPLTGQPQGAIRVQQAASFQQFMQNQENGKEKPKFLSNLLKKMLPGKQKHKQTNSGFAK